MVKSVREPCTLPFKIYDANDEKTMIDNVPILDAFTYCSLCKLPELIRTGVVGFKIAGRGGTIAYQESTTKLYRELIDMIMRDQMKAFWEKVESLRKTFILLPNGLQTIQDIACEKKRCFYSPLFHAPYKLPESWRVWTKLQFNSIKVVE
jgi:collagenase-like PrtC family protease